MRQRLAETQIFWREFRQTFASTGAVLPSGTSLAKSLARYVGQNHPGPDGPGKRILEVGPGTGPVTSQIIRKMGPRDTLDLVELNERFVSVLQDRLRQEPRWQAVADRVRIHSLPIEELETDRPFDIIVSGLPLNNFSCGTVTAILDRLHQLAEAQATLSFFEYVAIRKAKSLFCRLPQRLRLSGIEQILSRQFAIWEIDRECVIANVPPAWVHHLRLPGKGAPNELPRIPVKSR